MSKNIDKVPCNEEEVSSIYNSLQDLEAAKCALQEEYKALLEEQMLLQKEVDLAREAHNKSSVKFMRCQELQQISKVKSEAAIAKIHGVERQVLDLQKKEDDLQMDVKEERDMQENDLVTLEAESKDLVELYVDAVSKYCNSELSEQAVHKESENQTCKGKVDDLESELDAVEKDLTSLSLDTASSNKWEIPPDQQDTVLGVFREEEEQCAIEVEHLRNEKAKALETLCLGGSSHKDCV